MDGDFLFSLYYFYSRVIKIKERKDKDKELARRYKALSDDTLCGRLSSCLCYACGIQRERRKSVTRAAGRGTYSLTYCGPDIEAINASYLMAHNYVRETMIGEPTNSRRFAVTKCEFTGSSFLSFFYFIRNYGPIALISLFFSFYVWAHRFLRKEKRRTFHFWDLLDHGFVFFYLPWSSPRNNATRETFSPSLSLLPFFGPYI